MTISELQELALEPLATLGNHTVDHELLTRVPLELTRQQITDCQAMLTNWIGTAPRIIAYPNGLYNPAIFKEAERADLQTGLASVRGASALPLKASHRMRLPQFALSGGANLERGCRVIMALFSLSGIKQTISSRRR